MYTCVYCPLGRSEAAGGEARLRDAVANDVCAMGLVRAACVWLLCSVLRVRCLTQVTLTAIGTA
jgi:hypothetical protein